MPNFWENDPVVGQPTQAGPKPIYTAPNPQRAMDNARDDRAEGRDISAEARADRGEDRQMVSSAIENAAKLRSAYDSQEAVKAYRASLPTLMAALQTQPNSTGDSALVYAFAKAMDPSGAVQQGDVELASSGASTFASTVARFNKEFGIEGGGTLPPEVRSRLREQIKVMVSQRARAYELQRQRFSDDAIRFGLDPASVIGPNDADPYREDYARLAQNQQGQANAPTNRDVYANGVDWVGDNPQQVFDRADYLQNTYGIGKGQEALIAGFWNANRGNQQFTVDAARQWYEGQGLPVPGEQELVDGVQAAKDGANFGSFDTDQAQSDYEASLDAVLAERGVDPESLSGAIGVNAAQGLSFSLADEAAGIGGGINALLDGQNPVAGYQAERDVIRREQQRAQGARPITSALSELGGGVATGALVPGRFIRSAGDAARVAATEGAIYGYGSGNGLADSALQAGVGAGLGAGIGYGASKATDAIANRARSKATARAVEDGVPPMPASSPKAPPATNDVAGAAEAPPVSGAQQEEVATVARKAVGKGTIAREARKALAKMATVNSEAKAAADRLGMEIPLDILSDSAQVQSLTGLARSQVGSEAETAWRATTAATAQRAENVFNEIDATTDLAQISDDVLTRLQSTTDSLQRQASTLRDEVTAAINPATRVRASNLETELAEVINNYGGLKEAKSAMTKQERSLLTMLGEGETATLPTYARLNRIRSDIGEAVNANRGPWADVNKAQLARYYKALSDDQMDAVEAIGGKELADKQRAANSLFSQMYTGRTEMQDLFGKNLEKGLAPLLRRIVTTGGKGDAKDLNILLNRVPEDLRGRAIASAIFSQAQTRTGANGGFSFANYAKTYRGLRQNAPIYSQIAKAVGPEAERIMRDLYAISNRMAVGENYVLKTGKSVQGMDAILNAESILGKVMSDLTNRGTSAAAATAGAVVGGPGGAAAGATLANATVEAMARGGATRLDKAHKLLSSKEFGQFVEDVAKGADPEEAADKLWGAPAFHRLAKAFGLLAVEDRRAWLKSLTPKVSGAAQRLGSTEALSNVLSGPARAAAEERDSTSKTDRQSR